MKYVRLGFHILMAVMLVVALTGGFSPPKTGSMMQDSGATIMPTVGVIGLWVIGAITLRVIRRISRS